MNPLILRMIAYFAMPMLGALAAWLATAVPGVSWDAVTQTVTIRLEALVGGLAGGVGIAATVFALWGNKS